MPHVSLDDDEVVELLLARPHLVGMAFERMLKERDDAREAYARTFNYAQQWREKAIGAGAMPTLADAPPQPQGEGE